MPTRPSTSITLAPAPALLAAAGLALAATVACGQGDPLGEPFPAESDLTMLGDGGLAIVGIDGGYYGSGDVAVGASGDINGDGLDDIVVGAMISDVGGYASGQAYVFYGRPEGLRRRMGAGSADVRFWPGLPYSTYAGEAVTLGGDLNGDGFDDLVITAHRGNAYIIFGGPDGTLPPTITVDHLDGQRGLQVRDNAACDLTGDAEYVGDINGDGIDDLALGARDDRSSACVTGRVAVIFGGPGPWPDVLNWTDLDGSNGVVINGAEGFSRTGDAICGTGDLDGNGIDDLAIGAPSEGDSGACYVVWGRSEFPPCIELAHLTPDSGVRISQSTPSQAVGTSVAGGKDLNADGRPDLALYGRDRTFIVYGRGVGFPEAVDLDELTPNDGSQVLTRSVGIRVGPGAMTADMNGDGIDDLTLVGAFETASGDPGGRAFVVFGRRGGFDGPVDLSDIDPGQFVAFSSPVARTLFGLENAAVAGDINRDGIADVSIASRESAVAYIVFGRSPCPPDLDGDGTLTIFDFLAFGNLFDLMDPAADFDGDGDFTIFDFLAFQNAFDAGCE